MPFRNDSRFSGVQPICVYQPGSSLNYCGPAAPLPPASGMLKNFILTCGVLAAPSHFRPVAEAFLNLGWLGIIFVFSSFGVVLALVDRRLNESTVPPRTLAAVFALGAPWIFLFYRLDAHTFVKSFLISAAAPLILAIVLGGLVSILVRTVTLEVDKALETR